MNVDCAIVSSLDDDPDMRPLVDMFREEMPVRVAAIEDALNNADKATLKRLVHQLRGAGGSYGFEQLTQIAGIAETAVAEQQDDALITQACHRLLGLCRAISGSP